MAEPKQKSIEIPALQRIVPAWITPQWMVAERWRRVVDNQPIAAICEEAIIADLQDTAFEIRAKEPKEEDKLADDIDYYKDVLNPDFFGAISGFDTVLVGLGAQDMLRIPMGGNFEVIRYLDGMGPLSQPHQKGHVYKLVYVDGSTLSPTFDKQYPIMQQIPDDASRRIFFQPDEIMRLVQKPRTEMKKWGYQLAPPEKIYLAILSLYRGDAYYANLLLDTPEAGILDLGDMSQDSATAWLQSFRELMTGIDPFKIPVLYEHTKEAKYINFGRPPTEMMFADVTAKYSRITHAGYGLTETDTGLGDPQRTLAGSIRDERRSRRSGFGRARETIRTALNRDVLPDYLEFVWVENDPESQTQKGRAFLVTAQALKAAKEAGFLTKEEGQAQLVKDGLITVEVELPEEDPEPPKTLPPQLMPPDIANRVPPSEGGRGDVTGKGLITKHKWDYACTQIDVPSEIIKAIRLLGKQIDEADIHSEGLEEYPHITIKFGLLSDEADPIRQIAAQFQPFTVTTGKTSLFENEDFDVLKIEIEGNELRRLNQAIADTGSISTHPSYHPHITIGYLKSGTGKKYLDLTLPPKSILVDVITLRRMDYGLVKIPLGAIYKAELGSEAITAVPKDSDHYDQLATIFRQAFNGVTARMGDAQIMRLVKVATRSMFPDVTQAFLNLADFQDNLEGSDFHEFELDTEIEMWRAERLKAWFGEASEFDFHPDALKANGQTLDDIEKSLNEVDWWKIEKSYGPSAAVILQMAFSEGAKTAAEMVQEFLYTEGLRDQPSIIGLSFNLKNKRTIKMLEKAAAEMVQQVNNGTKFYLKRIITAGVDEGLSSPAIAQMIREGADVETVLSQAGYRQQVIDTVKAEVSNMTRNRTNSIVNTEINKAESEGRRLQWRSMGLTKKAWVHTGPDTPCRYCQANIDRGFIDIDMPFKGVFGEIQGPPAHPQVDHCHIGFDEAELMDKAGELEIWTGE